MQFIITKLLGLFYSIATLPIKLEKNMQILNIIVTSAYILGAIKGILFDEYRGEMWGRADKTGISRGDEISRILRKLGERCRLR